MKVIDERRAMAEMWRTASLLAEGYKDYWSIYDTVKWATRDYPQATVENILWLMRRVIRDR